MSENNKRPIKFFERKSGAQQILAEADRLQQQERLVKQRQQVNFNFVPVYKFFVVNILYKMTIPHRILGRQDVVGMFTHYTTSDSDDLAGWNAREALEAMYPRHRVDDSGLQILEIIAHEISDEWMHEREKEAASLEAKFREQYYGRYKKKLEKELEDGSQSS